MTCNKKCAGHSSGMMALFFKWGVCTAVLSLTKATKVAATTRKVDEVLVQIGTEFFYTLELAWNWILLSLASGVGLAFGIAWLRYRNKMAGVRMAKGVLLSFPETLPMFVWLLVAWAWTAHGASFIRTVQAVICIALIPTLVRRLYPVALGFFTRRDNEAYKLAGPLWMPVVILTRLVWQRMRGMLTLQLVFLIGTLVLTESAFYFLVRSCPNNPEGRTVGMAVYRAYDRVAGIDPRVNHFGRRIEHFVAPTGQLPEVLTDYGPCSVFSLKAFVRNDVFEESEQTIDDVRRLFPEIEYSDKIEKHTECWSYLLETNGATLPDQRCRNQLKKLCDIYGNTEIGRKTRKQYSVQVEMLEPKVRLLRTYFAILMCLSLLVYLIHRKMAGYVDSR